MTRGMTREYGAHLYVAQCARKASLNTPRGASGGNLADVKSCGAGVPAGASTSAHRGRASAAGTAPTREQCHGLPVGARDTPRDAQASQARGQPTKYGNEKTRGYASKKEAKRARELHLLQAAGEITDLREQVSFELIPAQYIDGKCVERACGYDADFVYWTRKPFEQVVEDAKGMRTRGYIIKRKLMLRVHGIRVREV